MVALVQMGPELQPDGGALKRQKGGSEGSPAILLLAVYEVFLTVQDTHLKKVKPLASMTIIMFY